MTAIGTLGSAWRADVGPWGAISFRGRSPTLEWWLAADDRWHVPSAEHTVRQRLLRGAPVVETALRVPGGDAIHRVYAAAADDGLVAIEVENASPLPFAVAFSHGELQSARPPTSVPVAGIDLPPSAVVFPIGHRAVVRFGVAPGRPRAGQLPSGLPSADQVASGWVAQSDRGMRVDGLDDELAEALVWARCRLLLDGPGRPTDPAGFLLAAAERARLGEPVGSSLAVLVADTAEGLARASRGAERVGWDVRAAVEEASVVLRLAGEARAATDAMAIASRLPAPEPLPALPPGDAARRVAWTSRRLVASTASGAELFPELAPEWRGRNLAFYGAQVGRGEVSCALRWHGQRAALLWECRPALELRAPALDPRWSTRLDRGEALL